MMCLLTSPAAARFCGDDVQGVDVPCACGDTVVSDVALGDDPILQGTCTSDGLLVDSRASAPSLTIDLRGATLRGAGEGTGIWVLQGGADGARVISSGGRATIDGFRDGITGRGDDAVALVDGVLVSNAGRDGVRLQGSDFEVRATEVRDAGRDGFALSGRGFRLRGTRSLGSRRFGYFVMGHESSVGADGAGATAAYSRKSGFNLMGVGHRLVECEAASNGEDGVRAMGTGYELTRCRAHDNDGDGIAGSGGGWWLTGNQADDNGGNGLVARGPNMTDAGGNRGVRNGGARPQSPALQCRIGSAACAN